MYKMGEVKIEFQENMIKIGTLLKLSRFHRDEDENCSVWLNFGHIYNLREIPLAFQENMLCAPADENKKTAGTEILLSISAAR